MTDEDGDADLASRLEAVEAQPLDARADAYGALYDELNARLGSVAGPADATR